MPSALLIAVRFHDGRYHGQGDWPPSPARLFQALVAGAARGGALAAEARAALEWLERIEGAPVIAAPFARAGSGFNNFVPNNDLDAVGDDPRQVGKIRAEKSIRPHLFDPQTPFLHAWTFEATPAETRHAERICGIADDLYQLGRGVDMAWARAEILTVDALDQRLAAHRGPVHRPSRGAGGMPLACPRKGSLASLIERHAQAGRRFETRFKARPVKANPDRKKAAGQLFSQPPKPRFRRVAYDCAPDYLLFDLEGPGAPWPHTGVVHLVERIRDEAHARLADALPDKAACIERIFVGRNATEANKAARIRIAPLPSIGHTHADHAIRRILVEVPPDCPLPAGDIEWAFSGLAPLVDEGSGEILIELAPAATRAMARRFGVAADAPSRLWHSVTPAALPAARRRIDPNRGREAVKSGSERLREEAAARAAVGQALRHAGIAAPVEVIHVRREPFAAKGARAEAFAPGTRFAKQRLWHVEIAFGDAIDGPLLVGDGRYLGLGLMAPAGPRDVVIYAIDPGTRPSADDRPAFLQAARRALMAIARDKYDTVPRLFSGHEPDGAPARSGAHEHVFLAADEEAGHLTRLYVIAPWRVDRTVPCPKESPFEAVATALQIVRAGALGVVRLRPCRPDDRTDRWLGTDTVWRLATPYALTRHMKPRERFTDALHADIARSCARLGLPVPEISLDPDAGPASVGKAVSLTFGHPVRGPILLGRGSHRGSGAFRRAS